MPYGRDIRLCVLDRLGGFGLAFDGLQFRSVDRDPARFLLVRNDAFQIDMKQPVLELPLIKTKW